MDPEYYKRLDCSISEEKKKQVDINSENISFRGKDVIHDGDFGNG